MSKNILTVENDASLQDYMRELLGENGFVAESARSGSEALSKLKNKTYDIILLDLGLPDIAGESLLLTIRKDYPETPVIVVTAKDTTGETVQGFKLGASDYVTKPFNADILIARIKARLNNGNGDKPLKISDLVLNPQTCEVQRNSKTIQLSATEFKLLQYLIENKEKVLSRELILNNVWGYTTGVETRLVDVYVGYLRKKIDYPFSKKLISTVKGFGYLMKT